jgi:alkyl hydroperoxide reductase subunit F
VILATGARWREMNVPGEQEYRGKGVAYCPHCDGPLFKGKRVAVIGGGNSGVEAAIDLAGIVGHVTLLEFDSKLRADAVLQRKLYSLPNVTGDHQALTTEVTGDGARRSTACLQGSRQRRNQRSNSKASSCRSACCRTPTGSRVRSNLSSARRNRDRCQGPDLVPGVFAAGDCTTVPYKQIIIAMGEGAKASLSAFDHLIRMETCRAGDSTSS